MEVIVTQMHSVTQMNKDASARAGDPGGWVESGEFGGALSSLSLESMLMSAMLSLRCTNARHSRMITCLDSMMCVWGCYIWFAG